MAIGDIWDSVWQWFEDGWNWAATWVQWGTVPAWLSGIGTTSAFFATFYIIRRDSNTRRRAQASQVAYYAARLSLDPETEQLREDPKGDVAGIVITNLSKEAIYSIETIRLERNNFKDLNVYYHSDVLMPNNSICLDTKEYVTYGIDLTFKDGAGITWVRTLRRGRGLSVLHGSPTISGQRRRNRGRHYVATPELPQHSGDRPTITLQHGSDWRPRIFRGNDQPLVRKE